MNIACLDLEGVLVPEVWINVAKRTGIEGLSLTTRDIADYNVLMRHRLSLLDEHDLTIADIQDVIGTLEPLDGAVEFLHWLRRHWPVIILSDTFTQFAEPLMRQLDWPTLFCHSLEIDDRGRVAGYRLRMRDHKRAAILAFRSLSFRSVAVGDSYNDTTMLNEADAGLLFRAPENVVKEFPQFPVHREYDDLAKAIESAFAAMGDPVPMAG